MANDKFLVVTRSIPELGGEQNIYRFENDLGASVVKHRYSYGGDRGLWELGVIKYTDDQWSLNYNTPITSDVEGHLTWDDVENLLVKISKLEKGLY